MKKIYFLFLVLVAIELSAISSKAQTPQYYYHNPANAIINNNYFNQSVTYKFLFIYTQAELASLVNPLNEPMIIDTIFFRSNVAQTPQFSDFKITMGHTTLVQPANQYSVNFNSGSSQVVLDSALYTLTTLPGLVNVPTDKWTAIPINSFRYNFTDNLAVMVEYSACSAATGLYADNAGPITTIQSSYANTVMGTSLIARPMFGFSGTQNVDTTGIYGVINSYSGVFNIDTTTCPSVLTVADSTLFSPGGNVMIIQMKGAEIDTTNSLNFGNIIGYNGAGNYELAEISSVNGNNISLNGSLKKVYDVNGKVQLVTVPHYQSVRVNGLLSCKDWDGITGGVLALIVDDTLFLEGDIDASGKGFRGGNISKNPDGGCGTGSPDYYYPLYQPGFSWSSGGAMKGEGIADIDTNRIAGRGHLANGGGGGNKHNTGGGGGSNLSSGGQGGNELAGCPVAAAAGLGGVDLFNGYIQNEIFAGGGGGCGDYNNNVGSDGGDGGGIIFIRANTIVGNTNYFRANGSDVTAIGGAIADGGGGGGAGGTIIFDVQTITDSINVAVHGGDGGSQMPTYGCVGTGGGGGAGVLLTTQGIIPPNLNLNAQPGQPGVILSPGFSCTGSTYGATIGQTGLGSITGYTIDSVSGLPFISLGNDTTLCTGDSIVLNAGSGYTYQWSTGSTTQTVTVTYSGIYSVIISDGACSEVSTINVTFNSCANVNAALASSDTLFCEKQCIDFFDLSTNSPTSWQWIFNGAQPDTSTMQNPTGICYNNYGSFDVMLIACNTNGCDTIILANFISEFQNPVDSIWGINDTLFSLPAYSYQWYEVTNGIIGGATNQFYIPTQSGSFFCVVSDSIGCIATSNTVVLTGLNEITNYNLGFTISPNSFTTEVMLNFTNQNFRKAAITIYDIIGATVFQTLNIKPQITIDLSFLPKGIYLMEVLSNDERIVSKIVKQ